MRHSLRHAIIDDEVQHLVPRDEIVMLQQEMKHSSHIGDVPLLVFSGTLSIRIRWLCSNVLGRIRVNIL